MIVRNTALTFGWFSFDTRCP